MLSLVTSRPWVLRSGMCKPKAIRLAAATITAATAMPISTWHRRRGARSRPVSTTGIRTPPEALIAVAVTNAAPAPISHADSGHSQPGRRAIGRASPAAGGYAASAVTRSGAARR